MGGALSNYAQAVAQAFPPKSRFNVEQIPDLTGRVAIVTGSNSGVGKETVKALLQHNARVYMAARSQQKAAEAIADLKAQTGKEAIFLQLDLSSLASVRKAAKEFLLKEQELHILFNNAGVMFCPIDMLTADGYDMQFGTNVLGHFLFTELLMPALTAGAASSPDGHARVVTTSSSGAYFNTLHYETFREKVPPAPLGDADSKTQDATEDTDGTIKEKERKARKARTKQGTYALYYQSKFGNAVFAREVARRYADRGVLAYSCNPGNLKSELHRYLPAVERFFIDRISYPASHGALTQLWAGTMPGAVEHNGAFLIPWARVGRCRAEAYDPKVGEELWAWLQAQVQVPE